MHTLKKKTNVGIPNTCTLYTVITVLSNALSDHFFQQNKLTLLSTK